MQREVRERKKKVDERERGGGRRGGSFALAPSPTHGYFLCSHLFAPSPRSESLEQPRQVKGIIWRWYDLRLSRIHGSTELVMVPSLKERGRTNGWYAAKKAGKRV